MNKCIWFSFAVVLASLFYSLTVVRDLRKELREVKEAQRKASQCEFENKLKAHDIRMLDYIRLSNAIGEVYGLETEDEQLRLLYWTLTITNGMTHAERRLRIRKGLDGDDWPEVKK